MPRPISATISLDALRANFRVARTHAGGARCYAVVKANAYGHGLEPCARALAPLADGFALLDLAEARLLRDIGIRQPIVLLEGFFDEADLADVAALGLVPAIHCAVQLDLLERARLAAPIDVLLKVNTGMNRLGFAPDAFAAALARLRALPCVRGITLMSHFARADDPGDEIAAQLATFDRLAAGCGLPHSLANSAALVRFPDARRDLVRPGILLYGGSPMPAIASAETLGLAPVMTLASELIAVQRLEAGDAVGYGALFTAGRPMRVGVVACGYADGYPRHAGTGTPVLIGGQRTRTLGRVSMDMLAVDLSDLPAADVGTPVTLWGEGLPADEVAAAAGTISYELFCALARRVPVRHTGL